MEGQALTTWENMLAEAIPNRWVPAGRARMTKTMKIEADKLGLDRRIAMS